MNSYYCPDHPGSLLTPAHAEQYHANEAIAGPGQAEDNFVYLMSCGHEYDSAYPLPDGTAARCSVHGLTTLRNPDMQIPTWPKTDGQEYAGTVLETDAERKLRTGEDDSLAIDASLTPDQVAKRLRRIFAPRNMAEISIAIIQAYLEEICTG
jgi:hypothetical protein